MATWLRRLRWITRVGALLALVGAVVEFGFGLEARTLEFVHALEVAVAGLYTLTALAHLAGAPDRLRFLRDNWLDAVLLAVLAIALVVELGFGDSSFLRGTFVIGVQVSIVVRMLIGFARTQERFASLRLRPAALLTASFIGLILLGAGALMMPRCRPPDVRAWTFVEALFTSTSAVCVTGLSVRDVGSELSLRGQAVLLCLIQIGGLGLVTIGTAITVLERKRPSLRFVAFAADAVGVQAFRQLRRFLVYTLSITLLLELTGAAVLANARRGVGETWFDHAWWALFHSVSAFCNAGFGLHADSLSSTVATPTVPYTVAALVVIGGLGFPVLIDLLRFQVGTLRWFGRLRHRMRQVARVRWMTRKWGVLPWLRSPAHALQLPRPSHLELNSKLVLMSSAILIVGGALLFYLAEREGTLRDLSAAACLREALFHSISTRTAGFNTLDLFAFSLPALLLTILLMTIGASAVSTGGGIKTATVATVFLTVRARMRDRDDVEVFGRSLPTRVVNASISIVALYLVAAVSFTAVLSVTHPHIAFLDLWFETVSALSTVGLTHGATAQLDSTGRLVLALAMLFGRVGPLVIVWSFVARGRRLRYTYPEEDVVVS